MPDGVEVVPMGDMRARLAAMRSGDLQASVNSIEESLQLQEQGGGKMLTTFGDAVPDFLTHVVYATDAVIQKQPDLVRRFLRAWFKTAAFMRDHREATVKSVAQTMSVSEKVVDMAYDDEIKMLSFDGDLSAEGARSDPRLAEGSRHHRHRARLSRPCTIRNSFR